MSRIAAVIAIVPTKPAMAPISSRLPIFNPSLAKPSSARDFRFAL